MSENARKIFMTLVMSSEPHLTTLDMQNALENHSIKLGKKELNNWLSSLQSAGLVMKQKERGKPTTIPYSDKYTYDLWSLTEKGRETTQKLSIFMHKTPTLNNVKTIVERRLPHLEEATPEQLNQLEALYTTYRILKALRDQADPVPLKKLSAATGITPNALQKWLESQETIKKEPLYELHTKELGIMDRIAESIGLKRSTGLLVSLSSEGRRMASALP